MPYLPTIQESYQTQLTTGAFLGYNRNLKIGEGNDNTLEFWDMQNLTSDYYPLMANRGKRGTVTTLTTPQGLLAKESLAYVNNNKLYYNGSEVTGLTLTSGNKQLVSMGAYLVIWPDRKYLNTKNLSDYGSLDASFTSSTDVTYAICEQDGTAIPSIATEQPSNPSAGDWWLDTSTTPHSLKRYSGTTESWVTEPTVYVKISCTGIGNGFSQWDGVNISGVAYTGASSVQEQFNNLNGSHIIQALDSNWIVVIGLIDVTYTQTTGEVTVSRAAPDMDFITEANNRLWGCKYGMVNGTTVNEIYACALGDFKNWNQFQGISTDSYAASVGTDGKWTGAITHLGYPLFFKENVFHKVYVSTTGAHQIQDTACRGVQDGCHHSLAIVGERLFYKSRAGIMMYDGSLPVCVSDALGTETYSDAAAGALNDKYYVSMMDSAEHWHLFVLDTAKGTWHREDDTHALFFARQGNELFYINSDNKLIAATGTSGTLEDKVEWYAVTGLIGYTTVEQKYVSRFNFRVQLPEGSEADMLIEYDSDGVWYPCGHMQGRGTNTFMLPVRPRRCDHFRFRIEGSGDIRIYSIAKLFEVGSDVWHEQ